MMNSLIQNSYSGLKQKDFRVYPVQAIWKASVNLGKFTFNTVTQILPVMYNSFYSVVEIDVGANLDENTFTNAIDTTYNLDPSGNSRGFSFNFGSQYLGNTVFSLTPFCFSVYRKNCPVAYNFKTGQQKTSGIVTTTDSIQSTISGQLIQTADIVALGINSISIYAYFTILQITNPNWIAENVGNG